MSALAWGAPTFLASTLIACADSPHADPASAERSAIVNGQRSVEADDSVVELISKPAGSPATLCSGVLVAPNLVLTAVHCVAEFSGGTFTCNSDGSLSMNTSGAGTIGELSSPDQIAVHTGVFPGSQVDALGIQVFGTGTNQVCRNDFAIVVLDRDLALPIASVRLTRGVEIGEAMRVVGYGATENSVSTGRYERDHLLVLDRGQDAGGSTLGNAAPRTFVVGEGPCHGDSGGPIFSEETGAVVGVYSLTAASSCTALGVRNVYTRLLPFSELIEQAFQAAGHVPIEELVPDDAGVLAAAGAQDAGPNLGGSSGALDAGTAGGSGGGSNGGASGASVSTGGTRGQRPGGSGSSQDGTCACRSAGMNAPVGASLLSAFTLALLLLGRRTGARRGGQTGLDAEG